MTSTTTLSLITAESINSTLSTKLTPRNVFLETTATNTTETSGVYYEKLLGYIWDNSYGSINIMRVYRKIRDYELRYGMSSMDMYLKWKNSDLDLSSLAATTWLTLYLQFRNYVDERAGSNQ